MPWQLSGNGRSDWSTKLFRGLKAEAAAGFQSRRERCREPTPATPQYAAFSTYKAARVHRTDWWCGGMAARCARAAAGNDARWYRDNPISDVAALCRIQSTPPGAWIS